MLNKYNNTFADKLKAGIVLTGITFIYFIFLIPGDFIMSRWKKEGFFQQLYPKKDEWEYLHG